MTARHLEANGIPTVIIGSARDIVEQCAVPRFLFQDLPLGNPCGVPYDTTMQLATIEMSLDLLKSAVVSRTTVQTPFAWPEGAEWRDSYLRVDDSNREQLRLDGEARRENKARRRAEGTLRTN